MAHASEVGGHTVAHAERQESESSQVLGSSEEREDVMDTTSARGSPQLLVLELAAKLAEIAAPEEELVDNRGHDALASSEETASVSGASRRLSESEVRLPLRSCEKGSRPKRMPSPWKKPTEHEHRNFYVDPYTQDVLYSWRFIHGQPA